jgi:hypothetical protein
MDRQRDAAAQQNLKKGYPPTVCKNCYTECGKRLQNRWCAPEFADARRNFFNRLHSRLPDGSGLAAREKDRRCAKG